MATLNPQILLAQQHYKLPDVNIGETFTNLARIKAYQQSQKLEELRYGQLERSMARDDEFQRLASQLYSQDQPAGQPASRGLAGAAPPSAGPPPAPAGGPPPAPGGLSMAGSVPPPVPGQNYAMAPPAINQMPDAAQSGYQRAPSDMQSLATATAPMGGAQRPGMPPGIPAPTSMEPGTFTMAQGGPQSRGLAADLPATDGPPTGPSVGGPPPGPPAPPQPPGGLGGAQPGEPKPLMPQMNERVMMQLYAANPEKAGKLIESQLSVQSKKLEQTEKTNELVYQALTALQASKDPAAMYPVMLQGLREKGVQIPASFPKEYDAALMAFKLREHETLKNQIDRAKVTVEENRAIHLREQANRERTQSGTDVATTRLREEEAKRVPLQGQEDVARTKLLEQQTADLVNERKKEAGQVFEYTKDPKWNVYLSQEMQRAKLSPGTTPPDEVIAKARANQVEDKQKVVRDHGLNAVAKNMSGSDKIRVESLTTKGQVHESLMNNIDEIERLIAEGVYTNQPEERLKAFLANEGGVRAKDPMAARTARLYELGEAMALEKAEGKLGGNTSDTDLLTIKSAGGNFQRPKSALSMQESLKSIKKIARMNMDDANTGLQRYKETNELPKFGEMRETRLKILTPAKLEEAYQKEKAKGYTKEEVREALLKQGFKED
jgi:hypothetical protein